MMPPRARNNRLSALLLVFVWIMLARCAPLAFAAEPSSALLKAKQEAEAKGFLFTASHAEIVGKAKQEGRLRVIVSLDAGILKRLSEGFTKKYPFIQVQADEIRGIDAYTRQLQELKAGLVKGVDVNEVDYDYYNDYLPHEGSVFIQDTVQEKAVRGKKRSLVDWRHYSKMPEYMKKVIEACGFPRAEK